MPQSERCNQCDQALIKIDNRGEQLVGCLTCNLWAAAEGERWIRFSEEDLRALHQLRHGDCADLWPTRLPLSFSPKEALSAREKILSVTTP